MAGPAAALLVGIQRKKWPKNWKGAEVVSRVPQTSGRSDSRPLSSSGTRSTSSSASLPQGSHDAERNGTPAPEPAAQAKGPKGERRFIAEGLGAVGARNDDSDSDDSGAEVCGEERLSGPELAAARVNFRDRSKFEVIQGEELRALVPELLTLNGRDPRSLKACIVFQGVAGENGEGFLATAAARSLDNPENRMAASPAAAKTPYPVPVAAAQGAPAKPAAQQADALCIESGPVSCPELCKTISALGVTLQVILLREAVLGRQGAAWLAKGLLNCKNLRLLEVFHCGMKNGRGAAAIADAMCSAARGANQVLEAKEAEWKRMYSPGWGVQSRHQEELKLPDTTLILRRNNIVLAELRRVVYILTVDQCPITTLDLQSNAFHSDCASLLAGLLHAEVQAAGGAVRVREHRGWRLRRLLLGHNALRDQGATQIAEGLRHNMYLTSLDLGFNKIGVHGADALCQGLRSNPYLTELNLRGNHLGDEGAKSFAQLLKIEVGLARLDISRNGIGSAGLESIRCALQLQPSALQQILDVELLQFGDELRHSDMTLRLMDLKSDRRAYDHWRTNVQFQPVRRIVNLGLTASAQNEADGADEMGPSAQEFSSEKLEEAKGVIKVEGPVMAEAEVKTLSRSCQKVAVAFII